MYDLLYPYEEENQIKIADKLLRSYYVFTISNRPIAFYIGEKFPIRVENDTLAISKNDNLRFCSKFEQIVRKDIFVLDKICKDREEYIRKLRIAENEGRTEEVVKNLFFLGRYGIEWYFPYSFLHEKLRQYFNEEEIDKITDALKISDEPSYYLKIWEGLEKLKTKKISITEFVENYGFYGRKTLEKCKYEDPEYVLKLIEKETQVGAIMSIRTKRIKEKILTMQYLKSRVDLETFVLLDAFAKIDTENEIIHKERAKAFKFLSDKKVTKEEIIEILKREGMV